MAIIPPSLHVSYVCLAQETRDMTLCYASGLYCGMTIDSHEAKCSHPNKYNLDYCHAAIPPTTSALRTSYSFWTRETWSMISGRATILVAYMPLRFRLMFGSLFMQPCAGEYIEPVDLGPSRWSDVRRHVHGIWSTLFCTLCTAHQGGLVGRGLANHTMPALRHRKVGGFL